jgi:hypothetical protein
MTRSKVVCLLLVLGWSLLGTPVWAIDVRWMQKGVRVWYYGSVGSISSSDLEEAYLLHAVNGANALVTHHSASNHWGSPQPVATATYSPLDKGPCWIHPLVLQNLHGGNWMGLNITLVTPLTYTYDDFLNKALPAPNHFLPIKALFDLKPQRDLVKITYINAYSSTGSAYFDLETGLALYYDSWSGAVTKFSILSEINYDFARKRAFAEDDGPHTGFQSVVSEQSFDPFTLISGNVDIKSQVETRYGNTVKMWVVTNKSGPQGSPLPIYENYCYFGDIPSLRRIDMTQGANFPPDQWNPFGQYLWWWLPPTALNRSAINIYNVAMARTATQPLTFTSTETPQKLYFTNLWFGNDGYMTFFSAKDPTIGLDVNPSSYVFQYLNTVNGRDYYRNTMGRAVPGSVLPGLLGPLLLY